MPIFATVQASTPDRLSENGYRVLVFELDDLFPEPGCMTAELFLEPVDNEYCFHLHGD